MRRTLVVGSLAAVLGLTLLVPDSADAASCRSRKTTGTIVGGVGGALLGGAVTDGGLAGPLIGGVGGAVVGREIGKSGCRRTTAYRSAPRSSASYSSAPARPVRTTTYYDQYGNPIASSQGVTRVGYAPACRTTSRSFYDDRGVLIRRPVQICDR